MTLTAVTAQLTEARAIRLPANYIWATLKTAGRKYQGRVGRLLGRFRGLVKRLGVKGKERG